MIISPAQQLYYAWDLSHKKSVSDEGRFTGVLSEAKVDLNPHQIEAALFAFKSPLSKGAILADEVGLGKTIEAGIILSELWAEYRRHILIIVPASLRKQWNIELMEKFNLPSFIMERGTYDKHATDKISPFDNQERIIICSYNFAMSYADEISGINWDLVVYDEAHKLRNVYKKENITANTLKAALNPYKKLLLTATPLQNNLKELYGLISIIDDEFFSSVKTFDEQYNKVSTRDSAKYGELKERISHVVHRTLRNQVQEYVNYTKRTAFVQEYTPSSKEMELYAKVSLYLFKEGSIGIPDSCKALLSMLVRKILSSSAYALKFTLESIIERLNTTKEKGYVDSNFGTVFSDFEISSDEESNVTVESTLLTENDIKQIDEEILELNECRAIAESIEEETKAKELIKGLELAFDKIANIGALRKALIFTESCKTQEYLASYLEENGYSGKIVCFNGNNNSQASNNIYKRWKIQHTGSSRLSGSSIIDKKQALVDFFRNEAEIMIATEAGAEGINLQFCSLVVNYDMPWNPQRIEQRIGRCHRYGQKHDVVVMNFVNQRNAADRRVYELLNSKFNLFDDVFGSSDEIIGAIDSTINFEKKLNDIYQHCRSEQEINAAFDELQKELEDVISERIKETKKSLLENFDEDVVNKLKIRQGEDIVRVKNYNEHFWKLTKAALDGIIIEINEEERSFILPNAISADIPAGKYILNKDCDDKIQLRYGHPLGQWIVNQSIKLSPSDAEITFDLSSYLYRSMLVEEQKGKSGYLVAHKVKAENNYDSEETILFSAINEDGVILTPEFCNKLLETTAVSIKEFSFSCQYEKVLEDIFNRELELYKVALDDRTSEYANFEIEKYESWAKDQIVPLQNDVIELRNAKDTIHRQIRKETNAKSKLLLKRQELDLNEQLRKKQKHLFDLEDDYSAKVDKMTNKLLKLMENKINSSVLFKIRWFII